MFSIDGQRKRLVLRQFHQEGFVNQYVIDVEHSTPKRLVFVSEALENLDAKWRARETYDVDSHDSFIETFDLAPPGRELALYSQTVFTRAR